MTKSEGILLVDKPKEKTSFSLVSCLRRHLGITKIGHAGTLDPFATGLMVMLVGKNYTQKSDLFLKDNKQYVTRFEFGVSTDSYDCTGVVTGRSEYIPSLEEVQEKLQFFQGQIAQVPPMFSAKKIHGKKLYELAREGKEVVRQPSHVWVQMELLDYCYPYIDFKIDCSKGTYIRSLAHDLGQMLGCGAHVTVLQRTASGKFSVKDAIDGSLLFSREGNGDEMKELIQASLIMV
jgi:tRNA pseudouridine55 synthase